MDVYREHLRARQIVIIGEIDDSMVEKVTLQLSKFNEQDDEREAVDRTYDRVNNPITLKIFSPGGLVSVGLSIVSQIQQSETPVIGYAIGDVASMATTILASCHARFISKYSRVMVHSLSGGTIGKLQDMFDHKDEVGKLQGILDEILVSRTRITQKMLDDLHTKKQDWYMSAEEALKLGIVDEVMIDGLKVTPVKNRKAPKKTASKE